MSPDKLESYYPVPIPSPISQTFNIGKLIVMPKQSLVFQQKNFTTINFLMTRLFNVKWLASRSEACWPVVLMDIFKCYCIVLQILMMNFCCTPCVGLQKLAARTGYTEPAAFSLQQLQPAAAVQLADLESSIQVNMLPAMSKCQL